jgi:hypothetical protein
MHWQEKSVPSDELAFVAATNTFINRQRDRTKVTTLLTQAAELAIRQGTECISAELIDQAAANGSYKRGPVD